MPIPVNVYVPQLAIVGNARLRGLELRALVIDDPGAGAFGRSPDVFRGFEWEGGFEPSFYVWLDQQKARGLLALRVLSAVDPADWILDNPPPPLPRPPRFVLIFDGREVWGEAQDYLLFRQFRKLVTRSGEDAVALAR